MVQRPVAFGIDQRVEALMRFIKQFRGFKAIKTQEPVGLIKPVLAQQRRLGIDGRQQRI